ncbi:MAG TPA: hypothetical protein PKI00_02850 [Candidatus Pacearchaeota archaeon]|nr:hypothetical protein [Candidatus Pacearchaeota archaeon]
MNLKKTFSFFILMVCLAMPLFICMAQVVGTESCDTDAVCQAIVKIKNYVLMLGAVVVGMMIIIGGFLYATAGGNEKQVDTAKKTITYAVIGMIVMLAAEIIVTTVKSLLGFT